VLWHTLPQDKPAWRIIVTLTKVAMVVASGAICLSLSAGCGGAGYVGYDDGTKQTEIRAGVYRSKRIERPDGSKESRDVYGPHIEVVTRSEGAHAEAGAVKVTAAHTAP
jgi:hypothetical protein